VSAITGVPRRELTEIAVAVGGATLLTGSWVVVTRRDDVPAAEVRAFVAVNGLPSSAWPIVWIPMQAGSLVGSLVVVAATAGVTRSRRLAGGALLASQAAYWAAKVVKHRVGRGRPQALLPVVEVRERTTGLGFLSGHSAVAFALAAALTPALPRTWRVVPSAIAAVTGVGRVYAGAHLPLDVVGGVGLGMMCGIAARWAFGLGVGVSRPVDATITR
jgi:membrane-associated phospholipid phosphatase